MENVEDIYPLSPLQGGMLVESLLDPGEDLYFRQFMVRLDGEVDAGLLARAWERAVERHTILRTAFVWDGFEQPLQVVSRKVDLAFEHRDWRRLPEADQRRELASFLREDRRRGFDLTRAPLLRVALVRLDDRVHRLLCTHHHLVLDGWSRSLLLREVLALHDELRGGRAAALPPARPFRDYIAWHQRQDPAAQQRFWQEQLAGFTAPAPIAPERRNGRVAAARSAVRTRTATLPPDLAARLEEAARRRQVMPGTVVHGAWALLLARHGGEEDVVFGSVFSGRSADLPDIDSRLGMLINTLPLRVRVPGAARAMPWLRELQGQLNDLRRYEHSSLADIRRWCGAPPLQPLFETMVVFQPSGLMDHGTAALRVSELHGELETNNFACSLMALPRQGIELHLTYDSDRIDPATADRFLGHLREILAALADGPESRLDEIGLLSAGERHQVLVEWNDSRAEPLWGGPTVLRLFESQADATPSAVAVVAADGSLTFAELDRRANRLAHHLRALGVGSEVLVGMAVERSAAMIVALLGILKAGGAYLPLDPSYPRERLAYMLEDAGIRVIVTEEGLRGALPPAGARTVLLDGDAEEIARRPAERPDGGAGPESLAYVLYTSGSTGRPKGVQVSHGALANLLAFLRERPGLGAGDVVVGVTSLSFDIATAEVCLPLITGARLVVATREEAQDGFRLRALLASSGATFLQATPTTWRLLLEAGWTRMPGLTALCTGEALPEDLAASMLARAGRVWNFYGPTETTIWSTFHRLAPDSPKVPIGRPVANTTVLVLGTGGSPVPAGVTGELLIGGSGLARGYLGRPDLTAERFVPDPFGAPGGRLYRTGDLVRHAPGGDLLFLGRRDQQVKVRGFRIELGEIEAALRGHPGVAEAVAGFRDLGAGGALVAWIVPAAGGVEPAGLREHLRARLPEPMLPAGWVLLTALPLTPNGKIDRKALPDPEPLVLQRGGPPAPMTPAEEEIAQVWGQILGVEGAGAHDHFFELGGHSLLATRLTSRLRQLYGIDLSLRDVFAAPRLGELAARVEALRGRRPQAREPVLPVPRDPGGLPLSFGQQRLWFLDQLFPGGPHYNLSGRLRLTGALDVSALARTLPEIVRRHEALRTVFRDLAGEPRQVVLPGARAELPCVDLAGLPAAARRRELDRQLAAEGRRPFDLARGPLLRAALFRLAGREHVLLLALHHIVSDGWSMDVLVREIAALYAAFLERLPSPLPALAVQYADFAAWQRRWLTGAALEGEIAFWRERLAGAPPFLDLPADLPRRSTQRHRGAVETRVLSTGAQAGLEALSRREGASLFMTVLAGFQTLLFRVTGQDDVVVGSPVANRGRVEIEPLIGFFVNTVVLRARLDGDPAFREAVGRVRESALSAFAHQDLPFERLVEELQPERSLSHTPLFQAMVMRIEEHGRFSLPDLEIAVLEGERTTTKFDLALAFARTPEGLVLHLEHDVDLFLPATARRLLGHLETLLAAAAEEPERRLGDLPLLTPPERQQLLREWNDAAAALPDEVCLHELIERQAARTPEAVAVVCEGESLTYARLDGLADRWAGFLRGLGVGPETLVGVCMERSVEMVVGLLAVLKAGGAYVPIDPSYPPERLAFLLDDSRAPVLLTQERLLAALPLAAAGGPRTVCLDARVLPAAPAVSAAWPGSGASGRSAAYAIYTSGSTGRPKGVVNTHEGIVNRLLWMQKAYPLGPADRVLQKTPYSFDVSVWELFWPLLAGARLVIARPGGHQDPAYLARLIVAEGVTVAHFVPSMLQVFVEEPAAAACAPLRRVMASGEALPVELEERFFERLPAGVELHNLYGPTEAAVDVTSEPCVPARGASSVPIGRPVANTRIHLLDRAMRLVPAGVAGELHIGGVQLARGYLRRPELTAERFVPDPCGEEPGGRLYKTGDLARHLPGGRIEYLGRLDFQVKIRGFRIELGEIEAALNRHPGVRESVVVARQDRGDPGGRRLVAYVVPARGEDLAVGGLREALLAGLPEHMVPSAFVVLAEGLPLSPNGKVDRKALPPPGGGAGGEWLAPRTPTEDRLAAVWAEVLGRERIGAEESFFELGGHSLLATRVAARVREGFGIELPLRSLFEKPTVRGLAGHIDRLRRDGGGPSAAPPVTPIDRRGDLPLSFAQRRLWMQDRLQPGGSLYNMAAAVRLRGGLVVEAWRRSLSEIVRRHEILRTVYLSRGEEAVQTVLPAVPAALPVIDLSRLPGETRRLEIERLFSEETRRPFDLAAGPLLRVRLLAAGDGDHLLLLVLHHINGDGLSLDILVRELGELSEAFSAGLPSPLEELPVQYADFASWQRGWLQGEVLARLVSFWKQQLAGAPEMLALPLDRPRPPVQGSWGDRLRLRVPSTLAARLRSLSRSSEATLFMTLLAAFKVVLRYLSGQDDLVVGTNVAGRRQAATENLIGCFINQLVLRTALAGGDTFRDLLARVKDVALTAYAHQDLPFEKLVEELKPRRDPSRPLLYQVKVELLNRLPVERCCRHVEVSRLQVGHPVVRYDLHLAFIDEGSELTGLLQYNTDLFEAATIERIAGHYEAVLAAVSEDPDLLLDDLSARLAGREKGERRKIETDLETLGLRRLKQVRRRAMSHEAEGAP